MTLDSRTVLQHRYTVIRQIGKGGMGAVYEATDKRLGVNVALKQATVADAALHLAFEREARLLAKLRHPALPKVIDHFVEGEGHFLVMEFVPGEDLGEMVENKRTRFPFQQVLVWLDELLDALDYLHSQDPPVIHRDIKPQNLKLTASGRVILLDFGLAKGAPSATICDDAGSVLGYTPHYAPLEQMTGAEVGPRTDLYALAATAYHLITGVKPPDPAVRASKLLNRSPDPLQAINALSPEVPIQIAAVLHSGMAQSLNQRPRTAASMRGALADAAEAIESRLRHNGQPTVVQADAPTVVTSKGLAERSPVTSRKTALMHAAEKGHAEMVRLLVEAGADVNARDTSDKTALIYAAEHGHLDVARYLIEAGASL